VFAIILPICYYSQEHLQFGYIALNNTLTWFHQRASEMEYDEYLQMLKKVWFSCINNLHSAQLPCSSGRGQMVLREMTSWSSRASSLTGSIVNWNLIPPLTPMTKTVLDSSMMHVVDCFAQPSWTGAIQYNYLIELFLLHWPSTSVRAGIRDRADSYVMTEMSWPAFLYKKYMADQDNLEEGLFKSSLLVQVCHLV
jgi:hypothetical protein